MGIRFDEKNRVFYLDTDHVTYAMQLYHNGYLAHLYWGRRCNQLKRTHADPEGEVNADCILHEYAFYGTGDFCEPAFEVKLPNGTSVSDLCYVSHHIFCGKRSLEGLPSSYIEKEEEAQTLEITLEDKVTGLEVVLSYTTFQEFDIITRSAKLVNKNKNAETFVLKRALSMCVDFDESEFELMNFAGGWAKERTCYERKLLPGAYRIESKRGISSHQQNPFFVLKGKDSTEDAGEVFGFNLMYSGNFLADVEVDQFDNTRVIMGINPFGFEWNLKSGDSFQTPEVVLCYSNEGLGDMSRRMHRFIRKRICRGTYRDKVRPVLVNNWEGTYFDFTADKLLKIAKAGKDLGMELFVLDDGWFGKRDSDNSSLGDWVANMAKLPEGLDSLGSRINETGMKFGLWFEPEMVSPDSDLYREHPDWCIHVPDRRPKQSGYQRNQLVLDLCRKDVCEKIVDMLSNILDSVPIAYVKWDMNRCLTDVGSAALPCEQQGEVFHRYVLGLYQILERLTTKYPEVLWEGCSSGGARFDLGILSYMPQIWTSDNTDAIQRLKIQYGTSIGYPPVTMGAHVSACPNHQGGRTCSLSMRGNVAMAGTFGYEMDLTTATEEEKREIANQVAIYKEVRPLVLFGDFYRLRNPFKGNETAWMFVSEDKLDALLFYYRVLSEPNVAIKKIRLKGLDSELEYGVVQVESNPNNKKHEEFKMGGDELMYSGLLPQGVYGDFDSKMLRLKAVQ